jgi:hypothetical protein
VSLQPDRIVTSRAAPITDKTEIPRQCPLLEVPLYFNFFNLLSVDVKGICGTFTEGKLQAAFHAVRSGQSNFRHRGIHNWIANGKWMYEDFCNNVEEQHLARHKEN